MPLSKAGASFERTVTNLGGDPADPFRVFPEVAEHFATVKRDKAAAAAEHRKQQAVWEKANPEPAAKLKRFLDGRTVDVDFAAIEQKSGIATRAASGAVLAVLARSVENMIVCSADLSNSDNTGAFLKQTTAFGRGDFTGQFLQIGVSELTMAAAVNGMALHGGVIPACGTFFVFSDYMKPAVRLAAMMGLQTVYVWTHDAFRVGEDGPTHQPVEHEAQIRLLEKMANLKGCRSMLVLRPADAAETTVAWKMALENRASPTALLLSRQTIPDIPAVGSATRYEDALQACNGAYVVRQVDGVPDLTMVANGSEVSVLLEAAEWLQKEKGLKVQVVSAISEALFREQSPDYQKRVIPFGGPVLGLTAGSPTALSGLVAPLGSVVGLERFGASAPYKVLDEKFGYTSAAVCERALAYLEEYRGNASQVAALLR
jgi:transketolase